MVTWQFFKSDYRRWWSLSVKRKNQQNRQTGSRNLMGPKRFPRYGVPIWSLWPNIGSLLSIVAEKNVHICSMNYWWQKSDIWSQASYRYPISWETFLNPSDSYFLFADFVDFYTHLTYICICTFLLRKMFNVYKNQLSWQTGSWNLTGPKTLPTIWGTYMKLVTKYQISAINSCWEKCAYMFNSNYLWQKSDIWSQASYRYPISWEAFLDPSDSYFLFAKERGYHRWALAHSSSCLDVHICSMCIEAN
jgi:hypothetical protein